MSASRAPHPDDLTVRIEPMRRRHLRSVLRIEAQSYPRPWTLGIFLSELRQRDTLALRGIAWGRLRPVTALRHVDGSRLVFPEIQSWHGADTAN